MNTWMSFKWLLALPILMMFSCQGNKGGDNRKYMTSVQVQESSVAPTKEQSEMQLQMERGIVLSQVRDVYRLVRQNTIYTAGGAMGDMFDRMYCSKSWNKMLLEVRAKESETCSYFFEIDHWTMMREPAIVNFDEFEVQKIDIIDSVKTASVKFIAYAGDNSYTPAIIDLVYENGRWVIDNFRDLKYKIDVRESMAYFLRKEEMI